MSRNEKFRLLFPFACSHEKRRCRDKECRSVARGRREESPAGSDRRIGAVSPFYVPQRVAL